MFQVVKRDGELDEFKMGKITAAIDKAFDAKGKNYSSDMIDLLGLRVTADFQNIVDHSGGPGTHDSVEDNRPCNGEDLAADSENLSLGFVFNGRCCHGVGKSGDGNQTSGAAEFADFGIKIKSGENDADENQGNRTPGSCHLLIQPL